MSDRLPPLTGTAPQRISRSLADAANAIGRIKAICEATKPRSTEQLALIDARRDLIRQVELALTTAATIERQIATGFERLDRQERAFAKLARRQNEAGDLDETQELDCSEFAGEGTGKPSSFFDDDTRPAGQPDREPAALRLVTLRPE